MGLRKGLARQALVFGLRMDAKKMEGGGNRWYICLQPKGKMEIPDKMSRVRIHPRGGAKMAGKRCLLAMIFVTLSYAYASGATDSIGTVSARGDVRVDGYTVWGNGTLFDGTAVEIGQAAATLRLDNGTEIKLAINSHGVVYRDHLVLLQGRSQLKTLGAPFLLEADGLRVAPSGPNALGVISLGPANTIDVAAVTGEFRVVDDAGSSVAHVASGAAISFPAAQSTEAPGGSSFKGVIGQVTVENGQYYVTTDHGVKYELVTGGKDLKKFVGKIVVVSGFLQAPPAPTGITELLVTSIEINGPKSTGMTTQTKALIGAGIGGVPIVVGAGFSNFSLDWGPGKRMEGISAWVDWYPNRLPAVLHGLGIEAEGRDIDFGRPAGISKMRQDTGVGGAIYAWNRYRNFRPYAKYLAGIGSIDFPSLGTYSHDTFTVFSPGGGVEYHAWSHIWIRGDYEYQFWHHTFGSHDLNPNGFTIGASYDFRPSASEQK